MTTAALAVLGRGLVPVDQPVLRADDAGVLRGDGVFDTGRIGNGRVFELDAHLQRLARSAAMLDISTPPEDAWRGLVAEAVAASGAGDGLVRLVLTRGVTEPTAYVLVLPIPDSVVAGRTNGVDVMTLTLGVTVDARRAAPWLLGGAKTLSYAVNMASIREAESRGADDVIWLAAGGEVLEAPTATVCWIADGELRTVPTDTGILAGTTLDVVRRLAGLPYAETMVLLDDLLAADEVFLVSSVRGVAGVRSIDGVPRTVGPQTIRLRDAFEAAVAGN